MTDFLAEAAVKWTMRLDKAIEDTAIAYQEIKGRWPRWVVCESWVEQDLTAAYSVWPSEEERPVPKYSKNGMHIASVYSFERLNHPVGDA